ncbi:hypothetical protein ACFT2C_04680 [Promicromonospora sp. NPDC057138]|uniref:hypothetical protein n=1 Tax=Promicromonospora sp. NPDC057138 TaxID=3346031 RepID=UPI003634F05C
MNTSKPSTTSGSGTSTSGAPGSRRVRGWSAMRQTGALRLSVRHVSDGQDEHGRVRHRYPYLVRDFRSFEKYAAQDLFNLGPIDSEAALAYLTEYLYAAARAYVDNPAGTGSGDAPRDTVPEWLVRTSVRYLDELDIQLDLLAETSTGPADTTFTIGNGEP